MVKDNNYKHSALSKWYKCKKRNKDKEIEAIVLQKKLINEDSSKNDQE